MYNYIVLKLRGHAYARMEYIRVRLELSHKIYILPSAIVFAIN